MKAKLTSLNLVLLLCLGVSGICRGDWTWNDTGTILQPDGAEDSGALHDRHTNAVFEWYTDLYGQGSVGTNANTLTWDGSLDADAGVDNVWTEWNTQVLNEGHTVAVSGTLYADSVQGEWTAPEGCPECQAPDEVEVDINVNLWGNLHVQTGVWQQRWWLYNDPGFIDFALAGASAGAFGTPDPSLPGGSVTTAGGITNNLPDPAEAGGAHSSGAATIDSNDSYADYKGNDESPPAYEDESWDWTSDITFSIAYSDSYNMAPGAVYFSPCLSASASADTDIVTEECDWEQVAQVAYGAAHIQGTIAYTVVE
jgi:hypothetical protein